MTYKQKKSEFTTLSETSQRKRERATEQQILRHNLLLELEDIKKGAPPSHEALIPMASCLQGRTNRQATTAILGSAQAEGPLREAVRTYLRLRGKDAAVEASSSCRSSRTFLFSVANNLLHPQGIIFSRS